jgi:hypothetical protein
MLWVAKLNQWILTIQRAFAEEEVFKCGGEILLDEDGAAKFLLSCECDGLGNNFLLVFTDVKLIKIDN